MSTDTVQSPRPDTPTETWQVLRQGNARFVAGAPQHPRQDVERRTSIALQQRPLVAIFGCSDSRLSAEIIFDIGLGDAFVVRNAGQVISDSVVASLEYAVSVLNVPLILILGHDDCGAVAAAITSLSPDATPLPPRIAALVGHIEPAVRRVAGVAPDADVVHTLVDSGFVGREHLRDTVHELIETSELISESVATGALAVVGANYRLVEGRVETDIVIGNA